MNSHINKNLTGNKTARSHSGDNTMKKYTNIQTVFFYILFIVFKEIFIQTSIYVPLVRCTVLLVQCVLPCVSAMIAILQDKHG